MHFTLCISLMHVSDKLSALVHPDKNPDPRAREAFEGKVTNKTIAESWVTAHS
jgi:hypothetical protein